MGERKTTWKTEDAIDGGFSDIAEIRGRIVAIDRDDYLPQDGGTARPRMRIDMVETEVIEMHSDAPLMELVDKDGNEGNFKFWWPYSDTKSGAWTQGFLTSAEEVGYNLPEDIGGQKVVTLRAIDVYLVKPKTGEQMVDRDGKPIMSPNKFVFVGVDGESGGSEDITEYVVNLIFGKSAAMAIRTVATDAKAKRYPEIVEAVKDGSFAEDNGLVIADGKYALVE